MASDAELLALAEQAVPGSAPAPVGAIDPAVLARQVPPGTPGAVEGPVFKDPNAAPLIDPVVAAQTPALAPQEPVAPPVAPAPVQPVTPAPGPPIAPVGGAPTIGNAAKAADVATQAGFETAATQQAVGAAKNEERAGNAAAQHQVAQVAQGQADETARQVDRQQQVLHEAQQLADKAQGDHESAAHGLIDLMENKADAQLARARIFIALGAAGNALAGGGNPALDKLKMTLDNDFRTQSLKLRSAEHFAEMKAKRPASIAAQFATENSLLGIKHSAAYKAAADEAKAQAIANGASPEEAENNVVVQQLRQKALELNSAAREKLAHDRAQEAIARAQLAIAQQNANNNNPANKPLNEGQAKANKFGMQLEEAAKTFESLPEMSDAGKQAVRAYNAQQEAAEKSPNINAALTTVGIRKPIEEILTPEDARVYAAQQRFLTPLLRDESGAAIGAAEFSRRYGDLMPMPGDSASTKADKKAMVRTVIQGSHDSAGAAAPINKGDRPAAKSAPAANKHKPGDRVVVKGKVYTVGADGDTLEP